ncbi:MAG: hypothetical protein AB4911_19755 [Oscillochloridaceae bacterium umkhey_bin13]
MPYDFQRIRLALGLLVLSLALSACGANPQASAPSQPAPSATTAPTVSQPAPSATTAPTVSQPAPSTTVEPTQPPPSATPVPTVVRTASPLPPASVPTSPSRPVTGEIPDAILATMRADLSQRAGVAPDQITIRVAEAVTWPDGSMGCPQPNMMYPQVLIEGYRAILVANDRDYAYHSDARGNAFYCARPER